MTIVMGLDQHRAQITAEWIDTETGEVSRGRVRAGGPRAVRRFLERFRGQELEVGARGDDRLAVRGRGAAARSARWCIWPSRRRPARCAGTRSAPRPTGRTPGICASCFRPAGCRSRGSRPITSSICARGSGCRHTLIEQRGEWQQRIQAVLYHHGVPARARPAHAREPRLARRAAAASRGAEQITIALAMIDAIDAAARAGRPRAARYARRQPGCKALMGHYGIGALDVGHDPRRARRRPPVLTTRATRSATPAWKCWHQTAPPVAAILV